MKKSDAQKTGKLYLPGEEIDIAKGDIFKGWNDGENSPKSTSRSRIFLGIAGFVLVYSIVAMRLLDVCVLSNWNDIPPFENNQIIGTIHRADIVDRNGTIVATSLPTQDLDANAKKILKPKATTLKLIEIFPDLKNRFDDTYKKLKSGRGYYTIRRNLTPNQQSKIMAIGNPGLEFRDNEKRVYPHKNLVGHIIGTVDVDNNGTSGLELGLNSRITSSDIPVRLSIDVGVQDTVRNILQKYQKKFSAMAATAILMNANTAEIVAMVSLPDFDPNDIKDADATFNQATTRIYEPGSVLKVFNTAMALDSGKVKINEVFDTVNPLKIKSRIIKEFHGQGRPLNVREILVHSSNVGSARMALQAGFAEQYNFLKRLKMLETIKMELVETAKPLVMKEQKWKSDASAVATIGYGYGLAVSPLHIAAGLAAIVNGGLYNTPTVLNGKYSPDKSVRVMSDNTSKQMRKLLRAVVTDGSGRNANVLGYEVGGKTGTANKQDEHGRYIAKHVRTTFASAFPMSDPKYVLVVMLDDPKSLKETFGHTEAGWNAVPAAGEIIAATAPQLGVPANADLEEKISQKIIEASFER